MSICRWFAVGLWIGFFAAVPGVWAASAETGPARILFVEGDVQIRQTPTAEWMKAKRGDQLAQQSQVRTGAGSACHIGFGTGDGQITKLQSDSLAAIQSLEPVRVDLRQGKIFALVRSLQAGSSFEVSTPTAVAAARGTFYSVDFSPETARTEVAAFEDSVVHVTTDKGEQDVGEFQFVDIDREGIFGEIAVVSEEVRTECREIAAEFHRVEQMAPEAGMPAVGEAPAEGQAPAGTTTAMPAEMQKRAEKGEHGGREHTDWESGGSAMEMSSDRMAEHGGGTMEHGGQETVSDTKESSYESSHDTQSIDEQYHMGSYSTH